MNPRQLGHRNHFSPTPGGGCATEMGNVGEIAAGGPVTVGLVEELALEVGIEDGATTEVELDAWTGFEVVTFWPSEGFSKSGFGNFVPMSFSNTKLKVVGKNGASPDATR